MVVVKYLRSVWRSVLVVDRTRLRRWSAARRGVIVIFVMASVTLLSDAETGGLAAAASLFVGLQDRGAAPRYTARIMLAESVVLAAVIGVAGYFSEHRVVTWGLLVAAAVGAGITAEHDKAISRMLGDIMPVAAFLGLTTADRGEVLVWTAAVLYGGLLQAVMALFWVRISGDIPERRTVAAALVAVADHLDDALVRRSRATGKAAEDRLTEAAAVVARSDLSHDRRHGLRKLLGDAEVLRQEAAALRARLAFGVGIIDTQEVVEVLVVASKALRETATALTSVGVPGMFDAKQEAALAELYPCRLVAEQLAEDKLARPTARAIARQTLRVYRHVGELVGAAESRTDKRSHPVTENLVEYFRHPTTRDLLSGARLGFATVLAFVVARALHLPHGSWVAATTVALLRPDYRALTADTVTRALGTAVGAAIVLPMLLLTGHGSLFDLLLIGGIASVAFAVVTVNEGLFVIAMTVNTVFTRSIVGEDPLAAARLRVLDVMVGCALALVLLFAVPLSHGRRLNQDMAKYAEATADWVDAVTQLAEGEKVKGMADLRRNMRNSRVAVQHDLELRVIEPLGQGLSAWFGEVVFTHIHDGARAMAAAERSLKHGDPTGEATPMLGADTAFTLRSVAEAVRSKTMPQFKCVPPELEVPADDAIGLLVEMANHEAHAALSVLTVSQPVALGEATDLSHVAGWAPWQSAKRREGRRRTHAA